MERLDKVLAGTGRWSRREVKLLVRQGQVRVNGMAAVSAEEKIDPETAGITVGGESIRLQKFTYVMLHKPAGVLTATEDRRQATVRRRNRPDHHRGAAAARPLPGRAAGQGHGGAAASDG